MQEKKLFTYPMDLLETPSGAQAARGANRFAVRSQHAADVLRLIIALSAEGVSLVLAAAIIRTNMAAKMRLYGCERPTASLTAIRKHIAPTPRQGCATPGYARP